MMRHVLKYIVYGGQTQLCVENHIGKIAISEEYICGLVQKLTTECYGIAGLSRWKSTEKLLYRQPTPISVETELGKLKIGIHVRVAYGVNVPAVVRSLMHRVEFVIEEALQVPVAHVRVYVDEIVEL